MEYDWVATPYSVARTLVLGASEFPMSSPWLSFSIMTTMMCGTEGAGGGTGALFGAVAALTRVVDGRVGGSCRFAEGADVPGETAVEELTAGGADVGAESAGGDEVGRHGRHRLVPER